MLSKIKVDRNLAFVSECIRTEGSINKNASFFSFGNSHVRLIQEFKNRLGKIMQDCKLYEYLHVHIDIPLNAKKDSIKIVSRNRKIEKFNLRTRNRFGKTVKELNFIDKVTSYPDIKIYKIFLDNKLFDVEINIFPDSRIKVKSILKVSAVIQLNIVAKSIKEYLKNILMIPEGRKSYIIYIPKVIKNSSKNILKEVISAVFSCEGWLAFLPGRKGIRTISLEMRSIQYIQDIADILSKFSIKCRISKNHEILTISGKKNLQSFLKNFRFIQPEKQEKLCTMMESYQKYSSYELENICLKALQEIDKPLTIYQIAQNIDKRRERTRQILKKLIEKNEVTEIKNNAPKPYLFVSNNLRNV